MKQEVCLLLFSALELLLIVDTDTLVYLFPRTSDKGPSFKIRSSLYGASKQLTTVAHTTATSTRRGIPADKRKSQFMDSPTHKLHHGGLATPPATPSTATPDNSSTGSPKISKPSEFMNGEPRQYSLYIPLSLSTDASFVSSHGQEAPLSSEDTEQLVAIRNLFAFMVGQSLVATTRRPALFHIFMNISNSLRTYEFSNPDGSTFGDVAEGSFECYIEELELADVRHGLERTVDALVLGERMKSVSLFSESFVHAVGKYEELQAYAKEGGPSSKYNLTSHITRNRLERASIDLYHRQKTINTRLQDFDFPSLFAGILDSRTAEERKYISFGQWKDSFLATRKHVLSYYKQKYGFWPPKGTAKRNEFASGGLNRMVLRDLYNDFSSMYDLYVDRNSYTTRSSDAALPPMAGDDEFEQAVRKVLRRVFDEYDRSSPPVQPPVPFDTPILPRVGGFGVSDAKVRSRKIKDNEISAVLIEATNADTRTLTAPDRSQFLAGICFFERKESRGKNLPEIINLRAGMWMFMYVVLQALPMLVVDAPGIRWHQGVEYFLCEPPRQGLPWVSASSEGAAGRARKSTYGIPGKMPIDVVEHGVEGIYSKSHCWRRAAEWKEALREQDKPRQTQREAYASAADPSPQESGVAQKQRPTSYLPYDILRLPPILTESTVGSPTMVQQSPLATSAQSQPLTSPHGHSYDSFTASVVASLRTSASSTPVSASDWPSPPLGGTTSFISQGTTRSGSPSNRGRLERPTSFLLNDTALPMAAQDGPLSSRRVPAESPMRRPESMARCVSGGSARLSTYYVMPQQQQQQYPPQFQQQHQSNRHSQDLQYGVQPPQQAQPHPQTHAPEQQSRTTHRPSASRPSSAGPAANAQTLTSPIDAPRLRNRSQGPSSGPLSPTTSRGAITSPSSWRGMSQTSPTAIGSMSVPNFGTLSPTITSAGTGSKAPSRRGSASANASLDNVSLPPPPSLAALSGEVGERRQSLQRLGSPPEKGKATFDEIFADMEQDRGRGSWRDGFGKFGKIGSREGSRARSKEGSRAR